MPSTARGVAFAHSFSLNGRRCTSPSHGSSGHRLFVSAFMLASKVICDETYSNKSWSIVAQGMFQLRGINQMEREMCQYLEWELNVDPATLKEFEMGRCVGALAPLPLVLLGSGGFFCSTPVCGCTCTPPARLVGFWGIGFLDAGVWAHLCPSLGETFLLFSRGESPHHSLLFSRSSMLIQPR